MLWIKDPDPVFSRIRIRVTQNDLIRPDPDPQHWFTLLIVNNHEALKFLVESFVRSVVEILIIFASQLEIDLNLL